MYDHNDRNSSLAAEEIQVLKAISRVCARLAQKLIAKERQTKEGGKHNVKAGGYGYGHPRTARRGRRD